MSTKATKSAGTSLGGMTKVMDDLLGSGHSDTPEFEQAVTECIPSEFLLIASQDDYTQAQEDYFAMDHFKLGKHVPKYVQKANAGSVATCALLQLWYENPNLLVADNLKPGEEPINCLKLSKEIKERVKVATKLEAKPTISSSRPLGPPRLEKAPSFYIVPPGYTGTRRALLIGVVAGEGDDLKGPPNDITNIQQFLTKHCGFQTENITVLQDYFKIPSAVESFKKNILEGFEKMVTLSQPNDVVFIQFSGHGGRVGNSLYILPSDYDTAGQIMDQVILRDLIKKMPGGVYTTMLVDCCYSGTVGDLPYILQHDSTGKQEIDKFYDTDMRKEMIQKEEEGGEEYQLYKQARSQKRLENRVSEVIDFVKAAAAAGYDATAWAAKAGYEVTAKYAKEGYEVGSKYAKEGYEVGSKYAKEGYDVGSKYAKEGYDATAKAASKQYDKTAAYTTKKAGEAKVYTSKKAGEAKVYTSKKAGEAKEYTSKKAIEASQKASTLMKSTSKGASVASKNAATAMSKSGTRAVDAAKNAMRRSAKTPNAEGAEGADGIDDTNAEEEDNDDSAKSPDEDKTAKGSSKFGMATLTTAATSAASAATSAAKTASSAAIHASNSLKSSTAKQKQDGAAMEAHDDSAETSEEVESPPTASKASKYGLSSLKSAANSAAKTASSAAKSASSAATNATNSIRNATAKQDHDESTPSDDTTKSADPAPKTSKFGLASLKSAANSAASAASSAASNAGKAANSAGSKINMKGMSSLRKNKGDDK